MSEIGLANAACSFGESAVARRTTITPATKAPDGE
jgi:hypothetical protein